METEKNPLKETQSRNAEHWVGGGMMQDMFMEEVNPVFTTAQACLLVMAEASDEDAKKLASKLGFDRGIASVEKDAITEMEKFQRMKAIPGFTTMIEARFTASSNLIRRSLTKAVLDLPCGYTPRGLQFAQSGISYYGFDLPAVINAMSPACRELQKSDTPLSYHAVDATNYDSLRIALKDVHDELFITTEGLLMYLTQSELEEVFFNISRLLGEFGGIWVTTDNMIVPTQKRVMQAISSGRDLPETPLKTPKPENVFFDPENAEDFVKSMGFTLKKKAVYDYLPKCLNTLSQYSDEVQNKARDAFRYMDFWIMQIDPDSVKKHIDSQNSFQVSSRRIGNTQLIKVQGRLDTLTAPQLLALYRQENATDRIGNIDIEMNNLDYISSAGLRVLLIMLKERPENGRVNVYNLKPTVRSIIEASGFDNLLKVHPSAT